MATAVTPPSSTRERPPGAAVGPVQASRWRPLARGLVVASASLGVAAVVTGLVARFLAPNGLWLDEALSVNIARLPLSQMPGALVQDGSPPLYYLMLHYWMLIWGQGEFAVRTLSSLASVATLPFIWLAGLRAGGRRTAWAALLLAATSPWAIYYSAYARMYSLMALEAVLFYIALSRALEHPSRGRLVCVGALTAALMYTHYWDFYLLGAVGAWVLWRVWAEASRGYLPTGAAAGSARRAAWAMFFGALVFLPWSPAFVFQVLHTGTPWSTPPTPTNLLEVPGYFAGQGDWAQLLALIFVALLGLALFARPGQSPTTAVLELKLQPRSRDLAFVLIGLLVVAVVVGSVTGAAFDQRYVAVAFPSFILVCSLGLVTFRSRALTAGALSVACVAGLISAKDWSSQPRTEAVKIAAVLNTEAQPGDMVVYCPDQLGPAVNRLLSVPGTSQVTFPRGSGPQRVDWVNYVATIKATNVESFAQGVVDKLNPGARLWLVWRNGYQGLGGSCGMLSSWLGWFLPVSETAVPADRTYYEYANLTVFQS